MQHAAPPRKFARPPLGAKTRLGEAFIANMKAAVGQVQANRPGAAAGRDPEYLHQLRVGMRRLRSTLRACRALVRRKEAARIDRRLRDALRGLGEARDWDVFEATLARGVLRRHAGERAEAARRKARATARSAQFRFLADEVLAWARGRPWRAGSGATRPMADFARATLNRAHVRLLDVAGSIDWHDAPRRHRVRILVKRLRYGCECFAAAWPEDVMQAFLKRLRGLQQVLGELNDIDVQRRLLRQLAESGAPVRAVASAAQVLAHRERGLLAKLHRAWTGFAAVRPFWRAAEAASAPG